MTVAETSQKDGKNRLVKTGGGFLAAALPAPGISWPSLDALNFDFLNNLIILSAVVLFFGAILLFHRIRKKADPPGRVKITLKLAAFGLMLLFLNFGLRDLPHYGVLLTGLQGLITLFCLASLVIYLILDVYLYHHTRKQAPSFVREIISLAVYVLFAIVSLRLIFRIEISSIVTTTTVLTAAIAFAMQTTLGNVLAGFSVQNDRLLRLKTWIAVQEKGIFGQILNVGFRYTTLRNLENNLVMVPNSTLVQNTITSFGSQEDANKVAISLNVSLAYDLPPEQAKMILLEILTDEKEILADPPPLVRLRSFGESSIDYQLKFFLEDYANRDTMTDRVYSRVWYAVHREGLSFPFPHRQIIVTKPAAPGGFPAETVAAAIRKLELFTVLESGEVRDLAERTRFEVYGPGEVVVRQNDEGRSLFLVMKGSLQALINGVPVGELNEGSFFGEMSLLTGEPRKATVAALTEVVLAELSRDVIEPLLRHKPEILESLSAILAHREVMNEATLREADRDTEEVRKCAEYLQRLRRFFGL